MNGVFHMILDDILPSEMSESVQFQNQDSKMKNKKGSTKSIWPKAGSSTPALGHTFASR